MTLNSIRRSLRKFNSGYWGTRVYTELAFSHEYAENYNKSYYPMIHTAATLLHETAEVNGIITENAARAFEHTLAPLTSAFKSLVVHAIGHAHIDMNWMWRYDETVNIILETFRTVIMLMKEFPDFTFSQSQASCYKIVEKYDKALLEKIRYMVNAGRWEVTASTWTETDKNLPSGESLARHILYSKRYINKLFDLPEGALKLDFEPDTFGHNANVPEILTEGGVEYYYHCRGNDKEEIYNWRAPSGSEILVYREPSWYNMEIEPDFFTHVPMFCKRNGVMDMLKVYGVGDHGGGPTRRDLDRLIDMITWPVFPRIKFGTYHKYFDTIKPLRKTLPVVRRELNFVFTGCYTTQTRIKAANRLAEAVLFEAEALTALSPVKKNADTTLFEEAWHDVLFNQFHDILPGAGTIDTREYALGLFQNVLANANSQKGIVCYAIADAVDTSAIDSGRLCETTTSEGAGVGYMVDAEHGLARVERGKGLRRGYLLFNTAGAREDVTEFTIWDWIGDMDAMIVTDSEGNHLPFQILRKNEEYWQHRKTDIAVYAALPPMGWRLIVIDEDTNAPIQNPFGENLRVNEPFEYILENSIIRAEIDPVNGQISELSDKRSGKIIARNCGFNGLTESGASEYPAWMIGRYMNDSVSCTVDKIEWLHTGELRNTIKVSGIYKNSKLIYTISLDKDAEYLTINASTDWLEQGSSEVGIPQLHFVAELTSHSQEFLYDIQFGTIRRSPIDLDVPGLTYACSLHEDDRSLAIISRDKYGYRCSENRMSLTLIRSSFGPDPYPELFRHTFTLHLAITSPERITALSARLCHPAFSHSVPAHKGMLPAEYSLLSCDTAISGIKTAEDGSGDIIIRLYNESNQRRDATITLANDLESACLCSITETPGEQLKFIDNEVIVPMHKHKLATIRLRYVADK